MKCKANVTYVNRSEVYQGGILSCNCLVGVQCYWLRDPNAATCQLNRAYSLCEAHGFEGRAGAQLVRAFVTTLRLFSANSMLTAEKRRLDGELRGMQQEIDNIVVQMKNSEEKARKAVADAGQSRQDCHHCHGSAWFWQWRVGDWLDWPLVLQIGFTWPQESTSSFQSFLSQSSTHQLHPLDNFLRLGESL